MQYTALDFDTLPDAISFIFSAMPSLPFVIRLRNDWFPAFSFISEIRERPCSISVFGFLFMAFAPQARQRIVKRIVAVRIDFFILLSPLGLCSCLVLKGRCLEGSRARSDIGNIIAD